MANNNNKTKDISMFLYRNLVRQCSKIDKNPQYKQYFVTPKSLRPSLPTFFLPSVSFLQKLKVNFRESCNENLKTNDIVKINSSLSNGFGVLKNINLSKYSNYDSNQDQIILQMKKFYNKMGNLNNEHEIDPTIQQTPKSLNLNIPIINNNLINSSPSLPTKKTYDKPNTTVTTKNSIETITKPSTLTPSATTTATKNSTNLFKERKLTKKEQIKLQKQQLLEKQKEVKDRKFWPVTNEEFEEDDEDNSFGLNKIKPGTLLIAHPSLGDGFDKKVVLITHSIGGSHYGFFINCPIPTIDVLPYVDYEMKTYYEKATDEINGSKNFSKLYKYALKRPIGPLKFLNWNYGGHESISGYPSGIDELPCAQIIHPFSNLLGSKKIRDGLYIGGKLKDISNKIRNKEIDKNKLLMFIGCSMWRPGQLEKEIKEGAWFRAECYNDILFKQSKPQSIWADALESMGGDYRDLVKKKF
ncbi:hypothetical protein RB653_008870 [Dictyostelium firmibasis]|uniref:Uncharacterized protein n=1 Tax=Dictyostelium firmibasis TaxID=79012 RepID=A0AAN7U0X2_9MYCE